MRGLRVVLVAAIAVVALIAGSNPASAAVTTHTSALGAGYMSAPPDSVKSATTTFKVPDITCAHNDDFEGLFLGVFAFSGTTNPTMSAFAQASCNLGTKVYFAQVSDGTTNKQMSITIGDTITARLTETGTANTAFVKNVTQKTTLSITKAAANDTSVLVGDFGSLIVPTFSKVHMGNAKVNGVAIGDAPATNRERLKSGANLQIGASLVPSGQATFNLLFKANS